MAHSSMEISGRHAEVSQTMQEENVVPFWSWRLNTFVQVYNKECCPLLSRGHTAKVHIFTPLSFPDYSALGCEL